MNAENTTKTAVGFFFIILVGSIVAALTGGAFGSIVAVVSPEFVKGLFCHNAEAGLVRYAFAVGMIWGLFIGAAVCGFACFLAAIIKIMRVRMEYQKIQESNKQ